MKETLLVKHAVGGRTFIDSREADASYEVKRDGERWLIAVRVPPGPVVDEVLKWKRELNVFLFQEEEGMPIVKNWFYVKDGPVVYDASSGRLRIEAQSRIRYVPDEFEANG